MKENETLDTSVLPENNEIFIMEKIIGEQKIKNKKFYKIKWKYFPADKATLEPVSKVKEIAPLLVSQWNDEKKQH